MNILQILSREMSRLILIIVLCFVGWIACDEDKTNTNDTDTGEQIIACEDFNFNDPDNFLVNGGMVSHWNQTGYIDEDKNGRIDEIERVETEIDIIDICNDGRQNGKNTLVFLLGADN